MKDDDGAAPTPAAAPSAATPSSLHTPTASLARPGSGDAQQISPHHSGGPLAFPQLDEPVTVVEAVAAGDNAVRAATEREGLATAVTAAAAGASPAAVPPKVSTAASPAATAAAPTASTTATANPFAPEAVAVAPAGNPFAEGAGAVTVAGAVAGKSPSRSKQAASPGSSGRRRSLPPVPPTALVRPPSPPSINFFESAPQQHQSVRTGRQAGERAGLLIFVCMLANLSISSCLVVPHLRCFTTALAQRHCSRQWDCTAIHANGRRGRSLGRLRQLCIAQFCVSLSSRVLLHGAIQRSEGNCNLFNNRLSNAVGGKIKSLGYIPLATAAAVSDAAVSDAAVSDAVVSDAVVAVAFAAAVVRRLPAGRAGLCDRWLGVQGPRLEKKAVDKGFNMSQPARTDITHGLPPSQHVMLLPMTLSPSFSSPDLSFPA